MPADSSSSQPKKKRQIGPFLIEGKLGEGGMGIVYLATYTKTGHSVALKILTPALSSDAKLLARFEREMSILKKLKDPNIVRYYGGGKYKTQQYYAMELVSGGTIETEMAKKGRLPWEDVVNYARQICNALQHSHDLGVIHRDLKPANLFLTKNGQLKLGDFGIARDTQDTALTAAGRTVGTYAYMAPEQIIGKPPVSRKTDLYALGCVMYEMLTGTTSV